MDRLTYSQHPRPVPVPVFPFPLKGERGKSGETENTGGPETGDFGGKRGKTPKTETRPRQTKPLPYFGALNHVDRIR